MQVPQCKFCGSKNTGRFQWYGDDELRSFICFDCDREFVVWFVVRIPEPSFPKCYSGIYFEQVE